MSALENTVSAIGSAKERVDAIIAAENTKSLLRMTTCGSVDDGKSTLIGRLLFDSERVYEDQMAALKADRKITTGASEEFDYSLLVDGLQAEREQGITIDVAYRYFATQSRKFIIADAPGHEQYTRNMATAASNADLAIILIDAKKGVLTQTRRHARICRLFGISSFCVVVNKMDTVAYDEAIFAQIKTDVLALFEMLGVSNPAIIPISALKGDNIVAPSDHMPWFTGEPVLRHLENVELALSGPLAKSLRFPVQWVNRPYDGFRGFSGTVADGTAKTGDQVRVVRSGEKAIVQSISSFDGDLSGVRKGEAVTLVLDREIDVSRGDILVAADVPDEAHEHFRATMIWTGDEEMIAGRSYLMKMGSKEIPATVTRLRHRIDVNDFSKVPAHTLALNDLGSVHIATEEPVAFQKFDDNPATSGFILIDRHTGFTVGAGTIDFALRRSTNIAWQDFDVTRVQREAQKKQKAAIVWLTGLSGSGKSTIANQVSKVLFSQDRHVYTLDGDNVRHGLNKDLGFTDADRVENIRRVSEVARLMADSGLIVLVSFISPFASERELAREIAGDIPFYEVFVDTPLEVCEARDVKGLYAKARQGLIKNFTGIDSAYEAPENPNLHIKTQEIEIDEAVMSVVRLLQPS